LTDDWNVGKDREKWEKKGQTWSYSKMVESMTLGSGFVGGSQNMSILPRWEQLRDDWNVVKDREM
jgi:hypothetical protein